MTSTAAISVPRKMLPPHRRHLRQKYRFPFCQFSTQCSTNSTTVRARTIHPSTSLSTASARLCAHAASTLRITHPSVRVQIVSPAHTLWNHVFLSSSIFSTLHKLHHVQHQSYHDDNKHTHNHITHSPSAYLPPCAFSCDRCGAGHLQ